MKMITALLSLTTVCELACTLKILTLAVVASDDEEEEQVDDGDSQLSEKKEKKKPAVAASTHKQSRGVTPALTTDSSSAIEVEQDKTLTFADLVSCGCCLTCLCAYS